MIATMAGNNVKLLTMKLISIAGRNGAIRYGWTIAVADDKPSSGRKDGWSFPICSRQYANKYTARLAAEKAGWVVSDK